MTKHLTNSDIKRIMKRIDNHIIKAFDLMNMIRDSDHPLGNEIYTAINDGQGLFLYFDCEKTAIEILNGEDK